MVRKGQWQQSYKVSAKREVDFIGIFYPTENEFHCPYIMSEFMGRTITKVNDRSYEFSHITVEQGDRLITDKDEQVLGRVEVPRHPVAIGINGAVVILPEGIFDYSKTARRLSQQRQTVSYRLPTRR